MHIQRDPNVLGASNCNSNVGESTRRVPRQSCVVLGRLCTTKRSLVLRSIKAVLWTRMVGVVVGCI